LRLLFLLSTSYSTDSLLLHCTTFAGKKIGGKKIKISSNASVICFVVPLMQVQSLTPRVWGTCGIGVSLKMCGEDVAIDGLLQGGAAQV
jgi:hypothetical protein